MIHDVYKNETISSKVKDELVRLDYCCKDHVQDFVDEFYQGAFDSVSEYAYDFLNDTGFFEGMHGGAREFIDYYFDFESYGRDLVLGGDIFVIKGEACLHIFRSNI